MQLLDYIHVCLHSCTCIYQIYRITSPQQNIQLSIILCVCHQLIGNMRVSIPANTAPFIGNTDRALASLSALHLSSRGGPSWVRTQANKCLQAVLSSLHHEYGVPMLACSLTMGSFHSINLDHVCRAQTPAWCACHDCF